MSDLRIAMDGLAALAAIIERAPVDDVHLTKSLALSVAGEIRTVLAALTSAAAGDGVEATIPVGALPERIGRLCRGERMSDGKERICAGGCEQPIPAGHAIYWPERLGEYPDDIDPSCISCAIDRSEREQGWCFCESTCPDTTRRQPIDPHFAGPVVSFEVTEPYYLASCDSCGWVGSSEKCGRDVGFDDSDVYCPRCNASGADCGKVANRAFPLAKVEG